MNIEAMAGGGLRRPRLRLTFLMVLLAAFSPLLAVANDFFIANKGQWPEEFLYCKEIPGGKLWVKTDRLVLQLVETPPAPTPVIVNGRRMPLAERRRETLPFPAEEQCLRIVNVYLRFERGGFGPVEAEAETPAKINFFKGNDPSKWVTNVPTFGRIRIRATGGETALVLEGASCEEMAWRFEGDGSRRGPGKPGFVIGAGAPVHREAAGFTVETPFGPRRFSHPQWRTATGEAIKNAAQFGSNETRSDTRQELLWGTYLGGSSGSETAYTLTMDPEGNVILGGETSSADIPTPFGYDQEYHGELDLYIAKLGTQGNSLLWGTFLGGQLGDLFGSLVSNEQGGIVLCGTTFSDDMPVPSGFDTTNDGFYDMYIAKVSSTGDAIQWGTYLGGTHYDHAHDVAIGSSGAIAIAGLTMSTDIPVLNGYDPSQNGSDDMYVAMLSSTGTELLWGTFIGGSGGEAAYSLDTDVTGNVIIGGYTYSIDMPVPSAFDPTFNGPRQDMYIAKLSPDGSQLLFGTYLGGYDYDSCQAVACDSQGNVVVGGYTWSPDIPTTPDSYDPTDNSWDTYDIYLAKLSASGSDLLWGTYVGSGSDFRALALDAHNDVFFAGSAGPGQPTPNGYQQEGSGMYFGKLSGDGSDLSWASYLSGSHEEGANSITLDAQGNVIVTGLTWSPDIPTPNGYDQSFNDGGADMYVAKLTDPSVPVCALSCSASASPSSGYVPLPVAFFAEAAATACSSSPSFSWSFGDGESSLEQNPTHTYIEPGSYTWTLTVTADDKTCTQTGTIQVEPRPAPGDCDANGIVTIGEVQKAVNMFLGVEPVGCFVDCDGDGSISIGEVQKVINAFLGLQMSC